MELTQQEVMAIIGEQQLQIVAQRKYIAHLEAKMKELSEPKTGEVVPMKRSE